MTKKQNQYFMINRKKIQLRRIESSQDQRKVFLLLIFVLSYVAHNLVAKVETRSFN